MKLNKLCSMAALLCTTLHLAAQQSDILISGIVTDGNNPVENAVVTLLSDTLLADTTDSEGAFHITNATGVGNRVNRCSGRKALIRVQGKRLKFFIPDEISLWDVKLYTGNGRCIQRYTHARDLSGSQMIDLPNLSAGLYLVALSAEGLSVVSKLVIAGTKMYLNDIVTDAVFSGKNHQLSQDQTPIDKLKITKEGFNTRLFDISSHHIRNLSIIIEQKGPNETSLYKKYKSHFPVGVAIDGNSYRDAHAAVWKEHFNAAVCENEMKWASLQPSEGNFQFGQANNMVNAARSNGMLVRGHVLVWFDQTPEWVFQGASKQVLLQRMRNHIKRVMQEFKGRVYAWDVVNEAVIGYDANNQDVGEDLGKLSRWGYRNSKWYQIAGEDHIFEAFRAARAADPDAKLFYNDFWNYLNGKREFIISFVKRLQEENLIDGVGLQCHLNINPAQEKLNNQSAYQTVENLEKEILEYAALGLDVHITELDISIYTRDYTSDDKSKWYNGAELNEDYQNRLAARYREFFEMFRRNADKIQNVTFWGIADDNTWLSEFSSGRPDHPLLFDKKLKAKKAFEAIMDF